VQRAAIDWEYGEGTIISSIIIMMGMAPNNLTPDVCDVCDVQEYGSWEAVGLHESLPREIRDGADRRTRFISNSIRKPSVPRKVSLITWRSAGCLGRLLSKAGMWFSVGARLTPSPTGATPKDWEQQEVCMM